MSFCYAVRPLAGNETFTGQAVPREMVYSDQAIDEITLRSGLTRQQVETALQAFGEYMVEKCINCHRVEPVLGWFGFQGTCGGSHPTPYFAPTFDNLAINIALRLGDQAKTRMRELFEAESVGEHDMATPRVVRVTNTHTGTNNSYTAGRPIEVKFANGRGKLDPSQTTQGIFFKSTTGVKVRAVDYSYNRGSVICCTVPEGLTGPQELSASLIINGALRTGVFSPTLAPAASEEAPAPAEPNGGGTSRRAGKGAGKGIGLTS